MALRSAVTGSATLEDEAPSGGNAQVLTYLVAPGNWQTSASP